MSSKPARISAVILDLGGVVVEWNPRHLYRKIFGERTDQMEWFLSNVCSTDWNEQQDAGRPLDTATSDLVSRHPEWEMEIRAYYGRWIEMIAGRIPGTADIMMRLSRSRYPLFALSNWSVETFPLVQHKFEELSLFKRIFLSGNYGAAKPDPKFYRAALQEIDVPIDQLVFVDDNTRNVGAAKAIGLESLVFTSSTRLERDLKEMGVAF